MIVAGQKARPNWAFAHDAWNIVNFGMMMMTMIEAMAIVAVMAMVAMALGPDDDLIDIERD